MVDLFYIKRKNQSMYERLDNNIIAAKCLKINFIISSGKNKSE